ncbi:pilus assembly protein [Roseateles saccharophilus]|uniref:Type IV pilus assembly protein PilY1 n=1 Tax=Roseateles saccharophilus TaxID=304 RepID=A0A4R3UKG4_ROSSA|nr:PilC/PilY family type IV pilus protein [Roseateles saccharophilus]MDG0834095.1 pilus assembly protein [Roseateles saccharophilus]TCU90823.1 type IV pilus assembly protein PilY1 [Roseateles saccharophilus]
MKRDSRLLLLQAMVIAAGTLIAARATHAQVRLSDQPVFTSVSVPGNVALALSVEYPTAISVAHSNRTYSSANTYIGYFDPNKCYVYRYTDGTGIDNYFYPAGAATNRTCSGKWSGNYLNWASMQTIDPFRWALTGGYRVTDTTSLTVLEKAWGSNQGSTSNFPDSSVSGSTAVSGATPFGTAAGIATRIWSLGNKMRFMTSTSGVPSPNYTNTATPYNPGAAYSNGTLYEMFIRVKVCDPSPAAGGLESNCALYGGNSYKPTGLMQQYSDRIRFSAFGYLNDSNLQRDGGVMRARQKFIGPTMPVPGSSPVTNPKAEWDPATGIFIANPDPVDAAATTTATGVTVSNSGVTGYLNNFGELGSTHTYKTYDNVSEMYYAVQRYFRNLGNVSAWTSMSSATTAQKTTYVDNFPVITSWDDPIQYSCQRNFILGIGDVNTHADRNLPGATGASEPAKPIEVANDTTMNAVDWTNKVGVLQGMGSSLGTLQGINTPACCNNNGALMAGLAYWANTNDIRPDLPGIQNIQTYWLDVMEYQVFKPNNQFYLTAKYGGFNPPASFTPATATASQFANNAATKSWWSTTTDVMPDGSPRPDNFYTAGQASLMVSGLAKAFSSIATKLAAYSTSFSTSQPQVSTLGVSTYAAKYDSKYWVGDVIASQTSFDANSGAPTSTAQWNFGTTLMSQASGTGWDTGRNIVTYNPSTNAGIAFRTASLATSQVTALTPTYGSGNTAATLLNYIRGDRSNEVSSTASGSTHAYRDRTNLLGDIVNAKTVPVGSPAFPYSSAFNPGYDTFKSTYANRAPMVYAAANDGLLHAIDGSLTSTTLSGSSPGKELWAYVPNAVISGPTGYPSVDGLASLGNPNFVHHYLADATPTMADVDFGRTSGGTGTADWRTLLIGGLGKGGKALYAIDVTNPASVTSEGTAAQKVLWEFSDSALGFTYGQPIVTKTRKYGWVVIAGSGYNNADGKAYFFFINPRNGALLEKVAAPCSPACSSTNQSGMAHINAFVLNGADGYADAIYGGDLLGSIWRLDVTGGSGSSYPTPIRFAMLTASDGSAVPITTKPLPVVQPRTNLRFVTIGSGRMLDQSDISSTQSQRFFAILDGTNAAFSQDGSISGTTSSLPTGVTFPITVAQLAARTSLTTQTLLDLRSQLGWYVDLGVSAGGSGWRVLTDSTSFYGTVAFAATSPTSTDACSPDGQSRVYVLDLGSGYCALNTTDSNCYASNFTGIITDLRFISRNVNGVGKLSLVGGTSTGGMLNPQLKQSPGIGIKRLNVREIIVN